MDDSEMCDLSVLTGIIANLSTVGTIKVFFDTPHAQDVSVNLAFNMIRRI